MEVYQENKGSVNERSNKQYKIAVFEGKGSFAGVAGVAGPGLNRRILQCVNGSNVCVNK